MRVVRRDSASFWAFVERLATKMEDWPEWKKRAADAEFVTPLITRTFPSSAVTR